MSHGKPYKVERGKATPPLVLLVLLFVSSLGELVVRIQVDDYLITTGPSCNGMSTHSYVLNFSTPVHAKLSNGCMTDDLAVEVVETTSPFWKLKASILPGFEPSCSAECEIFPFREPTATYDCWANCSYGNVWIENHHIWLVGVGPGMKAFWKQQDPRKLTPKKQGL